MTVANDVYGFTWGPVQVTRLSKLPSGHRCLSIDTDGVKTEVYISPKGKRVRVFQNGKELK